MPSSKGTFFLGHPVNKLLITHFAFYCYNVLNLHCIISEYENKFVVDISDFINAGSMIILMNF